MPIVVPLDVMLARRKMRAKALAVIIGISGTNLSLLRSGKVEGVRFETIQKICVTLNCKPDDLLDFVAADIGKFDINPVSPGKRG